jgi:hypothetical protein
MVMPMVISILMFSVPARPSIHARRVETDHADVRAGELVLTPFRSATELRD